jgi:hypothetical protein
VEQSEIEGIGKQLETATKTTNVIIFLTVKGKSESTITTPFLQI